MADEANVVNSKNETAKIINKAVMAPDSFATGDPNSSVHLLSPEERGGAEGGGGGI